MSDNANNSTQNTPQASAYEALNYPEFRCPKCDATHNRGPLNGDAHYRCLNCGWEGEYRPASA